MKRENGYYWVKLSGSWIIAKWTCFEWRIAGTSGYALDDHFSEIDETQITREQPVHDKVEINHCQDCKNYIPHNFEPTFGLCKLDINGKTVDFNSSCEKFEPVQQKQSEKKIKL